MNRHGQRHRYGWLVWAVLLGWPANALARDYYLSPTGNDTAAGTSATTPWRTFGRVLNAQRLLRPGDTLVLLSGTYTNQSTGLPDIDCTKNANNGTASARITLRADRERQAFLNSDGSTTALRLWNCSYWNIIGIRAKTADLPASSGGRAASVIEIRKSSQIEVKRSLATHNNRYFNTHIYQWIGSHDLLFEDDEAYYFHRHAFSGSGHHITVRRTYSNSRHWADIPGGRASHANARDEGDEAITFYWGDDSLAENNISEHAEGMQATGKRNRMYGNITLDGDYGFRFASNCQATGTVQRCASDMSTYAEDNYGENLIAVNSSVAGADCDGAKACVFKNVTVIGAGVWNVIARDRLPESGAPGYSTSMTATNILALAGVRGFGIGKSPEPVASWLIENSLANGNSTANFEGISEPIGDTVGNVRNSQTVAASKVGLASGQCIAWVPEGSNMKRAGKGGSDIGASVLYQYENGALTRRPLWLAAKAGGQFSGCGAIVSGVNDRPGESCFDVHTRLNVNRNGCPFPAGYTTETNVKRVRAPANLTVR